jgi:hypothetical protein
MKLINLGIVPAGDAGTEKTVRHLIRLIHEGSHDPVIILTARRIVKDKETNFERAKAIFDFVKQNIQYVKDPKGLELIRPARKILEDKAGDCDEHVVLLNSLYRAVGFSSCLITISTPQAPDTFSHVYSAVKVDNIWYPVDTTVKTSYFGWEYPFKIRKKVWPINGEALSLKELEGIEGFKEYLEKILKAGKEIYEKGKKEAEKGIEKIKQKAKEIIEEQKEKVKEEIREIQTENVLMWSLIVVVILVLAWFLKER